MVNIQYLEGIILQFFMSVSLTFFGRVIDGNDTLEAMEKVPVSEKNRPLHEIKLLKARTFSRLYLPIELLFKVTIHANPIADATLR